MYTNVSSYKFITMSPSDLNALQAQLREQCERNALLGTILLAEEGMNLNLVGEPSGIEDVLTELKSDARFEDMDFKLSYSKDKPFDKLVVKIKPEIITLRAEDNDPSRQTPGEHMPAKQLKQWLDEGKDFLFLDTRNTYEVEFGKFSKAEQLNIENFKEFSETVSGLKTQDKSKPVVMYCTGGVRCEKASIEMQKLGYETVYQLQGGILKYFEEVGGDHYDGDCFVFDNRIAVNAELSETGALQCKNCAAPVSLPQQQSMYFEEGVSCPACYSES